MHRPEGPYLTGADVERLGELPSGKFFLGDRLNRRNWVARMVAARILRKDGANLTWVRPQLRAACQDVMVNDGRLRKLLGYTGLRLLSSLPASSHLPKGEEVGGVSPADFWKKRQRLLAAGIIRETPSGLELSPGNDSMLRLIQEYRAWLVDIIAPGDAAVFHQRGGEAAWTNGRLPPRWPDSLPVDGKSEIHYRGFRRLDALDRLLLWTLASSARSWTDTPVVTKRLVAQVARRLSPGLLHRLGTQARFEFYRLEKVHDSLIADFCADRWPKPTGRLVAGPFPVSQTSSGIAQAKRGKDHSFRYYHDYKAELARLRERPAALKDYQLVSLNGWVEAARPMATHLAKRHPYPRGPDGAIPYDQVGMLIVILLRMHQKWPLYATQLFLQANPKLLERLQLPAAPSSTAIENHLRLYPRPSLESLAKKLRDM